MLPKIFDAFEQGDGGAGGGLGLGLTIAKGLVQAHGGDIGVFSPGKGMGATFTVELPTVDAAIAPTAPPQTPAKGASPHPRGRILLVEDHRDTARALSRLLSMLGHQVSIAQTVSEALSLVDSPDRFDLMISDIGLPDGSGLDLMTQLRQRFNGSDMRAVALTGYGMQEDQRRALDAGFDAHMTKPVDIQKLADTINELLAARV
jgi:CheY-like chemotaxis protein